ncbi:methylglyoxal synthase [Capnocytophaga catalasegens]|uniref:Methylglyoxal synthase n=1 Tax=Capnocytophaga catalasegens TaxID=1004260 RepID=A0AAV5ARN2_9FLAO|nr:methylglyoxal synthase [Capnocytophaga catalasegens]GIZ15898.1 methylglyoxal synthase [Capnocytophaga catalasegens]GJM49962.1 methylglyoxal synthase [Capnocytophaga catalasegens]GJM54146.1 methylglyoxal synthase [Capnocytophaga catalasegens]
MKLAVIAHDGKKAEMVSFLNKHIEFLHSANIQIIATGTTGKHAQDAGLQVERVLSGPLGGDAQIAAQVAEGKIQAVFFFKDPMDKHPHEPDINMLLRICDVHNVPIATNRATAELVLKGLVFSKVEKK